MSALLKKKYCKEHEISSIVANSRSDGGESLPNPKTCSILSTVTRDDNILCKESSPVSQVPTVDLGKSVRFDVENVVTINADTIERDTHTLIHYRDQIWYTRTDYRNFGIDRQNSVRLWKMIPSESMDKKTCNHFVWNHQEYTIRGLENYVYESAQILSRQRDLYSVAVFQDPYNAERIRLTAQNWSRMALQQAQLYALQDAEDARNGSLPQAKFSHGHSPTSTPSSPLSVTNGPGCSRKRKAAFMGIAEMNKRLIEQHMKSPTPSDETIQKPKRRPSAPLVSTNSELNGEKTKSHRRYSTSSVASLKKRQPVSLRFHSSPQPRHLSLSEDFNHHMLLCNRAVSGLPLVASCRHHNRDPLRLLRKAAIIPPELDELCHQRVNIADESMIYHAIRRDSLYLGQRYRR